SLRVPWSRPLRLSSWTMRSSASRSRERPRGAGGRGNHRHPSAGQNGRPFQHSILSPPTPAEFDCHISAPHLSGVAPAPAACLQAFDGRLRRTGSEKPDHRHRRLLRPRRERPHSSATEQRDELAALHSITSSARASSLSETVKPSALAVLRLMTSSYLVGC